MSGILTILEDFLFSPSGIVAVLLLGSVLGAMLWYKVSQVRGKWRGRAFRRRGKKAERMAEKLLKKKGFVVLEKEPHVLSSLSVDDRREEFEISPDFKVRRGSQNYMVEVKSHGDRTLINQAGVRRQLVEYMYATGLPCLLVTTLDRHVAHVELVDLRQTVVDSTPGMN